MIFVEAYFLKSDLWSIVSHLFDGTVIILFSIANFYMIHCIPCLSKKYFI